MGCCTSPVLELEDVVVTAFFDRANVPYFHDSVLHPTRNVASCTRFVMEITRTKGVYVWISLVWEIRQLRAPQEQVNLVLPIDIVQCMKLDGNAFL